MGFFEDINLQQSVSAPEVNQDLLEFSRYLRNLPQVPSIYLTELVQHSKTSSTVCLESDLSDLGADDLDTDIEEEIIMSLYNTDELCGVLEKC
jgi:hypothetical protein